MNNLAVICSEFNKELVELLYHQANKQFKEYRSKARQALSSEMEWSLASLSNDKWLDFIQGKSELEKLIKSQPDQPVHKPLRQFISGMIQLDMKSFWVPGAGEIPLTAKWAIENTKAQAVLALGVIIRGQTTHYDFLCNLLQNALWDLQKTHLIPIIFSVLMVENKQQAEERVKKDRGAEGMKSLIQMIELNHCLSLYSQ